MKTKQLFKVMPVLSTIFLSAAFSISSVADVPPTGVQASKLLEKSPVLETANQVRGIASQDFNAEVDAELAALQADKLPKAQGEEDLVDLASVDKQLQQEQAKREIAAGTDKPTPVKEDEGLADLSGVAEQAPAEEAAEQKPAKEVAEEIVNKDKPASSDNLAALKERTSKLSETLKTQQSEQEASQAELKKKALVLKGEVEKQINAVKDTEADKDESSTKETADSEQPAEEKEEEVAEDKASDKPAEDKAAKEKEVVESKKPSLIADLEAEIAAHKASQDDYNQAVCEQFEAQTDLMSQMLEYQSSMFSQINENMEMMNRLTMMNLMANQGPKVTPGYDSNYAFKFFAERNMLEHGLNMKSLSDFFNQPRGGNVFNVYGNYYGGDYSSIGGNYNPFTGQPQSFEQQLKLAMMNANTPSSIPGLNSPELTSDLYTTTFDFTGNSILDSRFTQMNKQNLGFAPRPLVQQNVDLMNAGRPIFADPTLQMSPVRTPVPNSTTGLLNFN